MPPRSKPAPTLRSVAALAGVHPSTVSRAINPATRHLVASAVVDRVTAAARSLGYRPDTLAASLRTRRTRLVGIVVPDVANPVFAPILAGIEAELAGAGYAALIANAPASPDSQLAVVDTLIGRRVDGLILATARRDDPIVTQCLDEDVQVVLVNRAEARSRVPSVVSDDREGMRLAVEHLRSLGHRRIGHIAGPQHLSTGFLRRLGFEEAVAGTGLATAVATAEAFSREAGRPAADAVLEALPGLTAIVASNDLLALGAYAALAARGLRVPQDVSVVGHNDMPLVDLVAPPLTTVRIGHMEMGREAARLLLARLEQPDAVTASVVLAPTLVVRGSTAPPPGEGRPARASARKLPTAS